VSCKKVVDLHDERFDSIRVSAAKTQGFEVMAVRVQVEGLCPGCRRRQPPRDRKKR